VKSIQKISTKNSKRNKLLFDLVGINKNKNKLKRDKKDRY